MTISQTPFLSEILSGERIPEQKLGYFRARLSNRMHDLILSTFLELEKRNEISRADIARRLNREPAQISRWLGAPGNWTLDTVSDLLLSMGHEPMVSSVNLATSQSSVGAIVGEQTRKRRDVPFAENELLRTKAVPTLATVATLHSRGGAKERNASAAAQPTLPLAQPQESSPVHLTGTLPTTRWQHTEQTAGLGR